MSHWVGVGAFFRFEAGNKGFLGKVDLSFELRRATFSWIPGEVCHEAETFPGWCHLPEGQCVRNLNSDTTNSRIRPAIHWLVWWWKKSVQTMCFKNYKAMSKALSSSLGTHRARCEEKEGRCGVKKRKMLLIAPPFPTLQKSWLLWAWRYWVWRKEYWVEERNRGSMHLYNCFSDHLASGCQLSEKREFISAKICFCLDMGTLEFLGFSFIIQFIIHPT